MLDEYHQRRSVEIIKKEDDVELAAERLGKRCEFRADVELISSAQPIKLRKPANISTAIVRHEVTYTN